MMISVIKDKLLLILLLLMTNCSIWPDQFWSASVDIDNQSNSNVIVIFKREYSEKEVEKNIQAKSILKSTVSADRYSDKDKLSDNFDFIEVKTEDNQMILDLSGDELDDKVPYYKDDRGDDCYLLTITDEMIEAALARDTADSAVTEEETVDAVDAIE